MSRMKNKGPYMLEIKELNIPGYERVIEAKDPDAGLHCYVAIHNTKLGPALGGTRIYPYEDSKHALNDVLRLSRGMTYKSAVVHNGLGGGKSVIIADPKKDKTKELLYAFGRVIDTLQGQYIIAEDIGTTTEDMSVIREKTKFVAALPTERSSGDPSRFTAWGVFKGIRAIAQTLWGKVRLKGKTVAIQGLGNVGSKLARLLFWEGAYLYISDLDEDLAHHYAVRYGAEIIPPERILEQECDILVPCALGGVFNKESIPKLRCKAIAGAANNQLLEEEDGKRLLERGILYAPDYIINSGGIINASMEFDPEGYDPKASRDKVNHIYDTMLEVLKGSQEQNLPTNVIANQLAEYNLENEIGKRVKPLRFQT